MSMQAHGHRRYTGYGMAAILLWSSSIGLIRTATESHGPLTALMIVYAFGGVAGLVFQKVRLRNQAKPAPFPAAYLFGCGSLFVSNTAAIYFALFQCQNNIQVFEIGLINYLWPVITLILSVYLLKIAARPVMLGFFAVMAMVGVALASFQHGDFSIDAILKSSGGNTLPYVLGIYSAISWGVYSVLSRKLAQGLGRTAVPWFMLATSVAFAVGRFFVSETSQSGASSLWALIALTVITAISYQLWDLSMQKGHITLVASASYSIPFFSTLFNCFAFQMIPGPRVWAGAVLIVIGSLGCHFATQPSTAAQKTNAP